MKRVTECTNLNEHSSRSHALLIVTVHGLDRSTGLRTTGGYWSHHQSVWTGAGSTAKSCGVALCSQGS